MKSSENTCEQKKDRRIRRAVLGAYSILLSFSMIALIMFLGYLTPIVYVYAEKTLLSGRPAAVSMFAGGVCVFLSLYEGIKKIEKESERMKEKEER